MHAFSRVPAVRRLSGVLLTVAVLLAGGALTWVAARATIESEKQRARAELRSLTADIESAINDRLLAYEALMRSGVGVLDVFWPVASENWQRFAAQTRLASVYPGLHGIGFAARVDTPEQFQHWSAALRRFGSNDLDDWPRDSGRLPATAIVFLEPLDESNRLALGYDMMSEPRRRVAMERARDSGSPALSAKIVLVQDLRRGFGLPDSCCSCPSTRRRRCPRPSRSGAKRCAGSCTAPCGRSTSSRRPWPARVGGGARRCRSRNSPIPWIGLGGVSTTLLLAGIRPMVRPKRSVITRVQSAATRAHGQAHRRPAHFALIGRRPLQAARRLRSAACG